VDTQEYSFFITVKLTSRKTSVTAFS